MPSQKCSSIVKYIYLFCAVSGLSYLSDYYFSYMFYFGDPESKTNLEYK